MSAAARVVSAAADSWWPSTTNSASVVSGPVAVPALWRQHQRRALTTSWAWTRDERQSGLVKSALGDPVACQCLRARPPAGANPLRTLSRIRLQEREEEEG
jgi:hypothetical protein